LQRCKLEEEEETITRTVQLEYQSSHRLNN
jgi:hypothetical protein